MSVTLIVGSQAQLADGLPWLDRFAKLARRPPSIVVLGQDHQALARHAKSELAEISIMPGQVDLVDEDVEQLLAHLSAKRCHHTGNGCGRRQRADTVGFVRAVSNQSGVAVFETGTA